MKITQLTPGTGHFYCGSCLRDQALAQALRRRGHDVFLVPLYLPFHLEETPPPRPEPPVLMGGINLYLQHRFAWFRRLPRAATAFLDRPGLLRLGARRGNMTDAGKLGDITLTTLRGDDGPMAQEVERLASWLEHEQPDVVLLSNVMLAGVARRLRARLGCKVACTLQGEAPFLDQLREPYRTQAWEILRERVQDLDLLLPVSHYYGALLQDRLGVPDGKIAVVHNGIDLADLAPPPKPPSELAVGYLARMCADKGLPALVEAFTQLCREEPDLDVRLRVAGVQLREDRPLVRRLEKDLARAGLGGRAQFLPNLERADKVRFLQGLSVLSVPATYGESFGLYLLEAMACGVPVVQPRHGGFPEIVAATGGGVIYDPGRPGALARALGGLLRDAGERGRLGAQGRRAVEEGFTAAHMAARVEQVLLPLAGRADAPREAPASSPHGQ